MRMEAVRMPEQDVLSAVMRSQIVTCANPYLSLDPRANPLFHGGDAVQNLVRTYRGEVRTLLSTLSRGKISILDFSAAIDELIGRIRESVAVDMSAFSEIEMAVSRIREHIDVVCTRAREFISSPPGDGGDLSWADAELLRQVETARAKMVASAPAPAVQPVPTPAVPSAPAPAAIQPDSGRPLSVICHLDVPLKDHPEYWPLAETFLLCRNITDSRTPRMTALYRELSALPLGKGLGRVELQRLLGLNGNSFPALLNRLREKGLFLEKKETPQTPGCFVKVMGRAASNSKSTEGEGATQTADGATSKKNGRSSGCYCYGLVMVIEK